MVPSDRQLTVTPCGPTSAARPREKPMAAAFAAPYTTCLRSPRRPASETIVRTRPHELSIIAGRYAAVTPSPAARFRRMSGSHSSGPVSTKFFTVMPSGGMPALFTRMSTGPVSRTIPGTASRSVTSATTGWAAPPSSSISRTTFSARSPYRSLTHTSAPARASWMQMARPTPPPPPVTMATRPAMKFDQSRIVATAGSDLYDDGGDRRAPLRPPVDEPAPGARRVPAERLEGGGALPGPLPPRGGDRGLGVLRPLRRLGGIEPAPRPDLGARGD